MGGFLTRAQIPQDFARWILEITTNQWVILAILNVFFLVIGFFLHSAAAIILVVPIVISFDSSSRYRSDSFRLGGHLEPRARSADTAGGQCVDYLLCRGPRKYLGCLEN